MPAQQLPPLQVDPSIEMGKLGCDASYYIVKAPVKKGYASIALVQKGDSLTAEKRSGLSSAFLARMGVGPSREGFLTEKEGSTVYTFRDVPFYKKEILDSMLLYTFYKMAESSAPQAIIVSGDVEPAAELKKKMDLFSLLVQKLNAPQPEPAYNWNPNQPVALDFKIGPGSIAVTYAGNRIPDIFMNTAQALVTDIFGLEFMVLLKNRLEKDFAREGVTCSSITFDSLRSCDYRGDERYTVTASIAHGQEFSALRVMARTIASMDSTGVSVKEFTDAKEVLRPVLLKEAAAVEDKIASCIANFLFGANLAPASERVRLFARKNVPEETETRLFNKFASALLAGEDNLTLELSARDTLDPAEALMVYKAHYKNGLAVPYEEDYTWHGADSAGIDFTPSRVRIQKEKPEPVSGGTVWTFSNGIKVIYKEIKGSRMFNYSLVLGGGLSQIPDLQEGEGGHIGPMLELYDVGGIPAPVFRDMLEVNGLSMKADVHLNSLIVSGSAPSGKLAFLMKALLAICNEREMNREEFLRYSAAQELREPSPVDMIYAQLHPGFRYSERPGALTTQTQIKADAYFADRFARFNDGVLIISGDLETGVVKRILGRYLGGFGILKGTTPRRPVEFKQRNGTVTVSGDKGPRGIHVVMEAPMAVTSDNFYLSTVAAEAMKQSLIWELAPYGFTADVSVGPMTQPQERFYMEISCFPVPAQGLPADVAEPDVDKAITAVRAAISKAGKRLPSQADVQAWKNGLSESVKARLSTPEGFTMAQQVRYALNKDMNSRYAESIQAITPDKVRGFLASIASGGAVEYIVE
ncbi:MAG: hypothetical protein IK113_01200 [Bacteroidales bacterium]|nr:hypothetical protein [Bacteroidales bacterium]